MQSIDKYVVQAMDNYPYWLEGTIESLGYALAYDHKNVMALGLYGRLYAEQMQDYEAAKQYFAEALASDIHALDIYPHYAEVLLLNEDYEEASKLIDFSLTIKGINKAQMLLKKIQLLERQQDIKAALQMLKEVKLLSFSNDSYALDEIEKRLKAKKELLKPKKAKKKKSAKKAKKK